MFFKQGKMYVYEGEIEADLLVSFALGGYEKAKNQGAIPTEPSYMHNLWETAK